MVLNASEIIILIWVTDTRSLRIIWTENRFRRKRILIFGVNIAKRPSVPLRSGNTDVGTWKSRVYCPVYCPVILLRGAQSRNDDYGPKAHSLTSKPTLDTELDTFLRIFIDFSTKFQ